MMRKLIVFFLIIFTAASFAADYERSNWRTQIYLQGEPAYLVFEDKDPELLKYEINKEVLTVPLSLGFLWSPLITPFAKADIPLTIWLGLEVNSFQMGTIGSKPEFEYKDNGEKKKGPKQDRELSFLTYAPSVLAGFTFNLIGDLDMRVLGGFGMHFFSFYDEYLDNTNANTSSAMTAFVSGAFEYRITEVFQDVDLKIGVNVRKEFLPYEDIKATDATAKSNDDVSIPSGYAGITMDKISYKWPVRVGLELSLDFGRESRRDRRMRFALHDRDDVLRKNSEVKDTLSDWDCMAIERDYRFFLDENGELPDMGEAFTHTQFSDVLESFLAFCHPADLATKEKLYASLDSGKIEIKEYQVKQEDSRFDQVMASNDPDMLQMFLEYYPDSPRRGEIERKLQILSEYHKFREIQAQNTFKAYLTYLSDNPDGAFREEAEAGIFELVKSGNRLKDYEIYLKRFPDGKYVAEAKAALQAANNEAPSMIEVQTNQSFDEEEPKAEEPAVEEDDNEEEQSKEVKSNKKSSKQKAKAKTKSKPKKNKKKKK